MSMSRMQEIIKALEAERGDQAERLAWLDKQITEFRAKAGEPVKPTVSKKLARKPGTTKHSGSKPRGEGRPEPETTSDAIEAYLREHPGSTAGEVAEATGLKRDPIATRLTSMAAKGQLRKLERGYALPDYEPAGSGNGNGGGVRVVV